MITLIALVFSASFDTPPLRIDPVAVTDTPRSAGVTPAPCPPPTNLDFDLLGDKPQINDAKAQEIEKRAKARRIMLRLHVSVGWLLLVSLVANTVLGALNYYDLFGGGGYTCRYCTAHSVSATVSSVLFFGNLGLALFAPNPYPKPLRFDSAMIHRISMFAATAAILTEIPLGIYSETRAGKLDQRDLARAHVVVGSVATGLVIIGAMAYVF